MRVIEIHPYNDDWPRQFCIASARLRSILSNHVIGIEHIGSTAVPGLGAKDIIDIQISVDCLSPSILSILEENGYRVRSDCRDEFRGISDDSLELKKYYAREPDGEKRVHIHIRETGRFNHRFALLFRDFLRDDMQARDQYHEIKCQAARACPNDIDGYLAIKAPFFIMIHRLAEQWAESKGWDELESISRQSYA